MRSTIPAEFQRARNEAQVQQRRDDIVEAARGLVSREGAAGATLVAIGKEVCLAKSNIYRYFESREDILCDVFLAEAHGLVDDLVQDYRGLPRRNDLATCATIFSNACAARPLFCALHTELAGTLEEHVSFERVVELKTDFARLMNTVAVALHGAAPDLGDKGSVTAIRMFLHQLAGCWPFCHLDEKTQLAVEESAYAQFSQPFRKTFSRACYVVLLGLAQIDENDAFFDD